MARRNAEPGRARALIAFAVFGLFWGSWGAVLPAVQAHADVSDGELGLALLCIGVGALACMRLAGLAVDRWGSAVLPLAVLGFAGSAVLPGIATSATALSGTLLLGAASGALAPKPCARRRPGAACLTSFTQPSRGRSWLPACSPARFVVQAPPHRSCLEASPCCWPWRRLSCTAWRPRLPPPARREPRHPGCCTSPHRWPSSAASPPWPTLSRTRGRAGARCTSRERCKRRPGSPPWVRRSSPVRRWLAGWPANGSPIASPNTRCCAAARQSVP